MPNTDTASMMRKAVIRFSGDSGDGMQLTGDMFTRSSAIAGNDLITVPDYPAEIRAPQGSVGGVSSFQVQIGGIEIYTPGDHADVLVAMNPAALKTNIEQLKPGGTIVVDKDNFNSKNLKKAGYEENPLNNGLATEYRIVKAPIASLTKEKLKDSGLDMQSINRCRNMFALGLVLYMFGRPLKSTQALIDQKFQNKPEIAEANKQALQTGFAYAETTELLGPSYTIPPAQLKKGNYRNIDGNTALAWGLLAASEKAGKVLSLSSYPITPASEVLHEIARRKHLGAVVFQAEDEIAAVSAAIGAAFAGNLSATTTSGPGVSLKTEAMGLAVIAELPLILINVQRAGPSTGLPTKTEQSDLLQALYGRHGEAPLVVLAASTPDDCFTFSYEAARLAIEHMTPVMLLSDSYLASGTSPWRIPEMKELLPIHVPEFSGNKEDWKPYNRDSHYLKRDWMHPGMAGFEHRIGGLEKAENSGNLTYEPHNHEKMVKIRQEKIAHVSGNIPRQKVYGAESGELLVVGWGSTFGALFTAVQELKDEGHDNIGLAHFNYIQPLPSNTADIFSRYKNIVVCELNNGQFVQYLRSTLPEYTYQQYNKIQGRPFFVSEMKAEILNRLKGN